MDILMFKKFKWTVFILLGIIILPLPGIRIGPILIGDQIRISHNGCEDGHCPGSPQWIIKKKAEMERLSGVKPAGFDASDYYRVPHVPHDRCAFILYLNDPLNLGSESKILPLLVEFYKPNCRGCLEQEPAMKKIARENFGKLAVLRVDIEKNKEVIKAYGLEEVPTTVLFDNGTEVCRRTGSQPYNSLNKMLIKNCWLYSAPHESEIGGGPHVNPHHAGLDNFWG